MRCTIPLLGLALSIAVFGYAAQLSLAGAAVAIATFVAMAFPGVVLIRRALPEEKSALVVLIFGAILGLALGRFGLALVGFAFGPSHAAALLAMVALFAIALLFRGKGTLLPAWDNADTSEASWILWVLAIVVLTLAVPYWGVGRPTPQGYAFVPYFDRDYLNHVSLTAELATTLPPQNPYFSGERLHYYWTYHIWPAALVNLTGTSARDALNLTILPTVGLFVAALCLWARRCIPSRRTRYCAIGLGLFAYSYIGLLFLIKLWFPALARHLPMVSHAEYSGLSHSWFRDFLYEPHAVTSLTLLLTVLFLNQSVSDRRRPLVGWLTGLGFGAMLVTDAFIAMVGLLYFALANAYGFFRDRQSRLPLLLAAGMTILVGFVAVALGMFPIGSSLARLGLHPAAKLAPVYLIVELGPLFVVGILGIVVLAARGELRPYRSLLGLLALALLLAFTITVAREPNIALRKALKVAQIPLIVFAGAAALAVVSSSKRLSWGIACGLIVLPGLTTIGTDMVQYLDLVETRFPPTTYVSRDELEMLDWVRTNTAPDAVIQTVNSDRIFGKRTDLLIPALAQRRNYYGNDEMPPMFQVPAPLIEERKDLIRALFAATEPAELLRVLEDLPPLYLYVDETGVGPVPALRQLEAKGFVRQVHQCGRFSLMEVVRPSRDAVGRLAPSDRAMER